MKYTISSLVFLTKKQALKQLKQWEKEGTLNKDARVYEVKKTFKPVTTIELKELWT